VHFEARDGKLVKTSTLIRTRCLFLGEEQRAREKNGVKQKPEAQKGWWYQDKGARIIRANRGWSLDLPN
jgi:hypothetical protein